MIKCLVCQQVKTKHQSSIELLQPLPKPEGKWNTSLWISSPLYPIVQREAMQSGNYRSSRQIGTFIPFRIGQSTKVLADKFMRNIVRLHGVLVSIMSDRSTRFRSHFWESLQESLETRLKFSTSYHPQTDRQSERIIQILEDILRVCMIEIKGLWEDYLHLAKFSYNNSYQAGIKMAPFDALSDKKCRSPLCWDEISERRYMGPEIIVQTVDKVSIIREHLPTT